MDLTSSLWSTRIDGGGGSEGFQPEGCLLLRSFVEEIEKDCSQSCRLCPACQEPRLFVSTRVIDSGAMS